MPLLRTVTQRLRRLPHPVAQGRPGSAAAKDLAPVTLSLKTAGQLIFPVNAVFLYYFISILILQLLVNAEFPLFPEKYAALCRKAGEISCCRFITAARGNDRPYMKAAPC